VQGAQESIAAYIAELQRLAEHCEFGTQLDEMLGDRLVVGVRDDNLRRKLLTQTDTELQQTQELAIADETAARDASVVNIGRDVSTVSAEVHLLGSWKPIKPTSGSQSQYIAATITTTKSNWSVLCRLWWCTPESQLSFPVSYVPSVPEGGTYIDCLPIQTCSPSSRSCRPAAESGTNQHDSYGE